MWACHHGKTLATIRIVNLWPQRVTRTILSVPVFTKIMGIAFGLTLLFAVVMHGEITRTRQRLIDRELAVHRSVPETEFIHDSRRYGVRHPGPPVGGRRGGHGCHGYGHGVDAGGRTARPIG